MSLEAVTFDVTGTLIHCPRMPQIYSDVLARHGIDLDADDIAREFRVVWAELDCRVPSGVDRFTRHPEGARGWWRRLLERLCELLDAPRPSQFAAAELYGVFSHSEAWETYPEVGEALKKARASGLRLGVVSNWDERLPPLLGEMGLADLFETMVHSSALGVAKPHPDIFRAALRELGAAPENAAHVGDRQREDVEGAGAVGMRTVLLARRRPSERAVRDLAEAVESLL